MTVKKRYEDGANEHGCGAEDAGADSQTPHGKAMALRTNETTATHRTL
jgi:hypothetical protein